MCKRDTHPLYNCREFQTLLRDERWAFIKKNGCCMNCLKAGHMANKCRSPQSCRKCGKTHYTLLHLERAEPAKDSTTETVSSVTCVTQLNRSTQVLLMTCKAKIFDPDGTFTQARVFLDPGASCSFITERLAQQLRLPGHKDNTMIAGNCRGQCNACTWRR